MSHYNRRRFLQLSAAGFMGGAGALAGLGRSQAFASSSAGGYKALVGIMLRGGVDMFDAVLPRDRESFDAFAAMRPGILGAHEGSRDPDNQIALEPRNAADFGARRFGLAPQLEAAGEMFARGEAALIGSVGPLLEPVTRAQMDAKTANTPTNLFSHNDQQSFWTALGPEGQRLGWGGGMMDCFLQDSAIGRPDFATVTAGSGDVFLASANTRIFKAPVDPGEVGLRMISREWQTSGSHGADARARLDAYLRRTRLTERNPFLRDVGLGQAAGIQSMRDYAELFASVGPVATEFPDTRIGKQLKAIANSIHIRSAVGNPRQVFLAEQGGFDTHDSQGTTINGPLGSVFEAIAAFRAAMLETGAWDDVVVFTMSDFGRTLTENGDGTDHGWGSHHFAFGGAVSGGRIYGALPVLDPDAPDFTDERGRMIPRVSVEEYAATLGRWFGLDDAAVNTVLPNLSRMRTRDLGFLGGAVA